MDLLDELDGLLHGLREPMVEDTSAAGADMAIRVMGRYIDCLGEEAFAEPYPTIDTVAGGAALGESVPVPGFFYSTEISEIADCWYKAAGTCAVTGKLFNEKWEVNYSLLNEMAQWRMKHDLGIAPAPDVWHSMEEEIPSLTARASDCAKTLLEGDGDPSPESMRLATKILAR